MIQITFTIDAVKELEQELFHYPDKDTAQNSCFIIKEP